MDIKANGIIFNCEIDGADNAPWLIFSNSLATNLHMWDRQVDDLSDIFRILRYDQRGHGKTEVSSGRYTFDLLIADAVALMDALQIERTHWCGISMGGSTAMGAVQMHASRFDRIVVCDTVGCSTSQSAKGWEERIAGARQGGMQSQAEAMIGRWFPPETVQKNPAHLDLIRNMILTTPVDGFCGCAAALADYDFRSAMPTVKNPVLYLCGEKDSGNAAAMREMHQQLPGAEYVELPGAGHISNMDQPDMFAAALRAFLVHKPVV